MKRYTVHWDHRPPKNQVYKADDIVYAKTGSIATLMKDDKEFVLISNFQSIVIEDIEE